MAVGARSGHEEPERRPGHPGESPVDGASEAETPYGAGQADDLGGPGQQARQHRDGAGPDGDVARPRSAGSAEPEDAVAEPGAQGEPAGDQADTAAAGASEDEEQRARARRAKHRSFWKELPLLVGIALLLALLIKTFLVQAFSIPSDSMQNTLQRGDRVLVDKLTPWFGSEPERGEVVVFHDPGGWLDEAPQSDSGPIGEGVQKVLSFIGLMPSAEEKDLIKRVIAVGGDTVECKNDGPVKVNGKALDEPYIFPGDTPCGDKEFGPIHVPEGRIWVMGDHRQDSLDSRYHQNLDNGTVSNDEVVGRAIVKAWPINRWGTLPVPDTFDQPGLSAAASMTPTIAGFAGALPLVLWRRRRLIRKAELKS
ncbi:signal peptidase I [Streptomyces sp. 71268]|uniref:signal peptidase I n=1 Tax=Streptomyces sp. 71268 TaxID=3002640 RepID=UPI0023FA49C1|nr:signal peptidase I [Streptomyces sp. 71268]WEV29667.1 signal peptidase I [Streptomyces sp. 71268]